MINCDPSWSGCVAMACTWQPELMESTNKRADRISRMKPRREGWDKTPRNRNSTKSRQHISAQKPANTCCKSPTMWTQTESPQHRATTKPTTQQIPQREATTNRTPHPKQRQFGCSDNDPTNHSLLFQDRQEETRLAQQRSRQDRSNCSYRCRGYTLW